MPFVGLIDRYGGKTQIVWFSQSAQAPFLGCAEPKWLSFHCMVQQRLCGKGKTMATDMNTRTTKHVRRVRKSTKTVDGVPLEIEEVEVSKLSSYSTPSKEHQRSVDSQVKPKKEDDKKLLFPFGFGPQSSSLMAKSNLLEGSTFNEQQYVQTQPKATNISNGLRGTVTRKGEKSMSKQEALNRQEKYVNRISKEGFNFGLTIAKAFVNSIRDLGYKDPGTAMNELVDNAIESDAQEIHIATEVDKSDRVTSIAIIDDGHGMIPEMARASLVWGGTDREGSRKGFGRYGYGLPSASVSQGLSYSVLTRTDSSDFYKVGMDLDELDSEQYLQNNQVVIPKPVKAELPKWVTSYIQSNFKNGLSSVRTVIVWDKLDRLAWKKTDTFDARMKENLGLTYRNFLSWHKLVVNGMKVEPLDPLFTTEGGRFFDIDEERAEVVPGMDLNIPDSNGEIHVVKVRLSYMSPTFMAIDKTRPAAGKNANPRFNVRKRNNGFVVCRNGRQIDVVKQNDLTTFQNNDRHMGIELNFPAALDEMFGVTTSKQQITLSDKVWDHLSAAGFERALSDIRKRIARAKKELAIEIEKDGELNPSEELIRENSKFIRRKALTDEAAEEAKRNQENRIKQKAKESGVDIEVLRKQYLMSSAAGSFEVRFESISGNVFYSVQQEGGKFVLTYNTNHPFYENFYAIGSGPLAVRYRAGLDVFFYSMGVQELDGNSEIRAFYTAEKIGWTDKLSVLMPRLDEYLPTNFEDDQQANEEIGA